MINIYKDEGVTKKWKIIFDTIRWAILLITMPKILVSMRDKTNSNVSQAQEILNLILLILVCIYFMLYLIYWIKPSLFKSEINR